MKISWIARCPAPYRYPIWTEIARSHNLQVLFLQEQGIGRSWEIEPSSGFRQFVLHSSGMHYREDALWRLRRGWRRYLIGSDVVVMQGMWETPAAWQVALWCRRNRVPLIYFSESTLSTMHRTSGAIAFARSLYMRNAHRVITPGPAATAAVLKHGVAPSRLVTSVNVVDVRRFHLGARAMRAVPVLGDAKVHRYIVVARLVARKNVRSVLLAFAALPESARLEIVGDGPERAALEHLTHALDLEDRVRFSGEMAEEGVLKRLAASQTLVLASREEVWGLVVNEALAAGLHTVVSDRCGVAPSVQRHRGVYVCEPTPEEIARAMQRSGADWSGWIEEPEILAHDAVRFCFDFAECLRDIQPTPQSGDHHA